MNDIKLTLRKLLKNKTFTTINLVGLSVVFFVSLIIFSFVSHHYSFDKSIKDSDNVYRITTRIGGGSYWASSFTAFDFALDDCPEIESKSIFYKQDEQFTVGVAEKRFSIKNPIYADANFNAFFNFKLRSGKNSDINNPNSVFISPKMGAYLFGDVNPIGQTIRVIRNNNGDQNEQVFSVVGVFEPFSDKSHINTDIILSKSGFYEEISIGHLKNRKVFAAYTYVKLNKGVSPNSLKAKLHGLLNPYLKNAPGPPVQAFEMDLQAFKDIHFTSGLVRDISPSIRKSHLNILMIIGLLLFVTVIFNFLIMNIVSSTKKRQQSKIIQYLGALKRHIFMATFWEITIVVGIAFTFVIMLIKVLNPWLAATFFSGYSIKLAHPAFWFMLLSMAIVVIFSSSISASINSIRKEIKEQNKTRKTAALIVFQFTIVIALLGFTLIVNRQLNFIKNKDLGYSPENVMVLRVNGRIDAKINLFKDEVKKVSGVISAGTAQHYPGFRLQDVNFETKQGSLPFKFGMLDMDGMITLGVDIKETFNTNNDLAIYINETFYNKLAKNYTSEQIISGEFQKDTDPNDREKMPFYVNGVIKDFHYSSLYSPLGSFSFFVRNPEKYFHRFLLVRLNQENVASVTDEILKIADNIYPGVNMEPQFLDEQLNAQYKSEEQLLSVANIFSIITVIVACMGLMAFMLFNIQLRNKEIGIRKVNGAKVGELMQLLNKQFIICIVVAFLIACPLAYFAIIKWLASFAFKTSVSIWIFLFSGFAALLISFLTVSWQTFKAARSNPVEALRYE